MTAEIAHSLVSAAIFFGLGWGWGQWWGERSARKQAAKLTHSCITLSIPATRDQAEVAIGILKLMAKEIKT